MIARDQELLALDPRRVDLDAALRRIDQEEAQEARRVAAAPLPAVPAATRAALRRDALARLGLNAADRADLIAYAQSREHDEEQTGPDGHPIIRGT